MIIHKLQILEYFSLLYFCVTRCACGSFACTLPSLAVQVADEHIVRFWAEGLAVVEVTAVAGPAATVLWCWYTCLAVMATFGYTRANG